MRPGLDAEWQLGETLSVVYNGMLYDRSIDGAGYRTTCAVRGSYRPVSGHRCRIFNNKNSAKFGKGSSSRTSTACSTSVGSGAINSNTAPEQRCDQQQR